MKISHKVHMESVSVQEQCQPAAPRPGATVRLQGRLNAFPRGSELRQRALEKPPADFKEVGAPTYLP